MMGMMGPDPMMMGECLMGMMGPDPMMMGGMPGMGPMMDLIHL